MSPLVLIMAASLHIRADLGLSDWIPDLDFVNYDCLAGMFGAGHSTLGSLTSKVHLANRARFYYLAGCEESHKGTKTRRSTKV